MSEQWKPRTVDIYQTPDEITRWIEGDAPVVDQVDAISAKQREALQRVRGNPELSEIGRANETTRLVAEYRESIETLFSNVERRLNATREELEAEAKPPPFIGPSRERAEAIRASVLTEANLLMGGPWEAIEAAFERDLAEHGERSPEVHAWVRVLVPLAQKSGVDGARLLQVKQRVEKIQDAFLGEKAKKAAMLLDGVERARIRLIAARQRFLSQQYFLR